VLPGLSSNEKNSSYHQNSYNKGPNLAFFSFTKSPSNSLPTIKFPKNNITSSYHNNMPNTAKAKIWPLRTLGVKTYANSSRGLVPRVMAGYVDPSILFGDRGDVQVLLKGRRTRISTKGKCKAALVNFLKTGLFRN
jgi:hypothetical protein